NNDGLPELLAASYGRFPNHLWRAVPGAEGGAASYENVSIASGYAFDERVDWTDNVSAQCHCADYPDDEDCGGVPAPPSASVCQSFVAAFGGYRWNHATGREPFNLGGNSATTVCADIDNDGWVDLMTGEIVHWDVGTSSDPAEILLNTQDPAVHFTRPGNDVTGLTRVDEYEGWDHGDMTAAVFDFDNDGWQDIYIGSSDYPGNKALLYHQTAPAQFQPVALEDYFLHYRAHGVAIADFDRDGDLDVVAGHSLMRCEGFPGDDCGPTPQIQLYENQVSETTRWLQLHLTGAEGTNRAAIGARVEVSAGGVTQTHFVDGGHGHFGLQRDLTLHIGLGQACEAQVTVHWPDRAGSMETFTATANQRLEVVQGAAPVEVSSSP
ncbi:MAG: CRTAC1 family protein, partial [Myxococcota bacterium]|nr:CRTAC1 family protein [Myxococcota bacterium]